MDWRKYAAELVALEKLPDKLRKEGWFSASDLAKQTGWSQSKCACHCSKQAEIGKMETQLLPNQASSGRVIETRFYRLK